MVASYLRSKSSGDITNIRIPWISQRILGMPQSTHVPIRAMIPAVVFPEIKILNTESTQKNSQKSAYAAALAVTVGSKHIVGLGRVGALTAHVRGRIIIVLIH